MLLELTANFRPTGDQPRAIAQLTEWIAAGHPHMTLLGVTGSGKTFTMAGTIAAVQRPALVISPNKTLAAQLYGEFKEFFPSAAVHYFVSYYDYYQPEAYVPSSDTYIEKEAQINEEIDRLRHAATQSLLTRSDVIIVASVSCIYGLGSPEEYGKVRIALRTGDRMPRKELLRHLIELQFQRNDMDLQRGAFRVKGDTVEVYPKASDKDWIRIECDGDRIERITARDIGGATGALPEVTIFPATHYVAPAAQFRNALDAIREELTEQVDVLRRSEKIVEAARLEQRTRYDLDMLEETGYVHGIENYSRYFDRRQPGQPPFTLVDFYNYAYGSPRTIGMTSRAQRDEMRSAGPRSGGSAPMVIGEHRAPRGSMSPQGRQYEGWALPDRSTADRSPAVPGWLTFIDESHITIPQIRGMYAGDRSRKETLVNYGFRLPSCFDNRPLQFAEFTARVPQTVYVSATPEEYEIGISRKPIADSRKQNDDPRSAIGYRPAPARASGLSADDVLVAEQLIRPTGLLDPDVDVRPTEGQMADLLTEIRARTARGQRVLVTVLTKRMAEDLAEYLRDQHIKAFYIHADVETFERVEILDDLRRGTYDVIVGINLLREGLDLPEVSLVAILDADKEGYLRSRTALIQTMGRAARHGDGRVICYADRTTESMRLAIAEVRRRRATQEAYNRAHGIIPTTITKIIRGPIVASNTRSAKHPPRKRLRKR